MGGKINIGGTLREISAGKANIGGTLYEIKQGKTNIDGTLKDINFKLPSVIELFQTVEIDENGSGCLFDDNHGSGTISATVSGGITSFISTGEFAYCFYCVGNSLEISRINRTSSGFTKTRLYLNGSYSVSIGTNGSWSYSGGYGCCLALVKFGSKYSSNIIDQVLTQMGKSCIKSYHSSSQASSSTLYVTRTSITNNTGVCFSTFEYWPGVSPDGVHNYADMGGISFSNCNAPTSTIHRYYSCYVEYVDSSDNHYSEIVSRSTLIAQSGNTSNYYFSLNGSSIISPGPRSLSCWIFT